MPITFASPTVDMLAAFHFSHTRETNMLERLLTLLILALLSTPQTATAQQSNNGFWVARDVSQGMSESSFLAFAKQNDFEVTTPLPDKDTKSITIDGTNFWLTFCDGTLTNASWTLPDNTAFHRSLDKWINQQGFQLSKFEVSSKFDDRSNKSDTVLNLTLKKPESKYSVNFYQFAENSQIMLEDIRYDDFFGCVKDKSN